MPIELQELRKQLIYEETGIFEDIQTDLDDIKSLSQLAKIRAEKFSKQALYYFIGLVSIAVISFSLYNSFVVSGLLSVTLGVMNWSLLGLTVGWIYALIMRSKFMRLNLINYRYYLILQVIQMLRRDLDTANSMYLKLSFQRGQENQHKINTIPHPYKPGWNIDIYRNQWLNTKGRFLDKTRFTLTITELSKKQYGWKHTRSGKKKYKSKVKYDGLDISLSLNYSQDRYNAMKILQNDVRDAIKIPEFCYVGGLKVTERSMSLRVRISPDYAKNPSEIYQTIIAMFLSVYQVLNLAKMLSEQKV